MRAQTPQHPRIKQAIGHLERVEDLGGLVSALEGISVSALATLVGEGDMGWVVLCGVAAYRGCVGGYTDIRRRDGGGEA